MSTRIFASHVFTGEPFSLFPRACFCGFAAILAVKAKPFAALAATVESIFFVRTLSGVTGVDFDDHGGILLHPAVQ